MFIVPISQMPSISEIQQSKAATQATNKNTKNIPFADMLANAMREANEAQAIASQDSYELAMGKTDDLHNVMINAAKARTALEFTVELTSRAVNAYNEILRMQI